MVGSLRQMCCTRVIADPGDALGKELHAIPRHPGRFPLSGRSEAIIVHDLLRHSCRPELPLGRIPIRDQDGVFSEQDQFGSEHL